MRPIGGPCGGEAQERDVRPNGHGRHRRAVVGTPDIQAMMCRTARFNWHRDLILGSWRSFASPGPLAYCFELLVRWLIEAPETKVALA